MINIDELLNADRVRVSYLNTTYVGARMIKNIMERDNLSVTKMALILGVRKSTVEHYLEGRDIPNCGKMIIALIDAHPEVIPMIYHEEIIKNDTSKQNKNNS